MSVVLLVTVQWYQVMSSCVSQHEIGVRPPDTNNCEFTAASATPQLYIFCVWNAMWMLRNPGFGMGWGMSTFHGTCFPKLPNGNSMLRPGMKLRSRDLTGHCDNSWLSTYILAFMLRWNAKPHVLKARGSLAKKASR